jgi:hypothetical protein
MPAANTIPPGLRTRAASHRPLALPQLPQVIQRTQHQNSVDTGVGQRQGARGCVVNAGNLRSETGPLQTLPSQTQETLRDIHQVQPTAAPGEEFGIVPRPDPYFGDGGALGHETAQVA